MVGLSEIQINVRQTNRQNKYVPKIPPLIVESIDVRFLRRLADSNCCSVIEVELGFR